ncbi:hypothetical protein OG562_18180 [Streptomyces sp. NBC_01275]|uniref:hypothetical protein n=1 Tax=Streptomyces sp. NBC_01275 TaxID=2903807 RepID=UPI00225B5373|nr:hypothetical protein [Streptomyces sp. NBC_01275]MCX4762868.1 hypothetical protein [Streptomyces sp. NBC_01275]
MKRNFHQAVSRSVVRVVVGAGAALLIGVSPMMSISASAEVQSESGTYSSEAPGVRLSDVVTHLPTEIQANILRLAGLVNGWQ